MPSSAPTPHADAAAHRWRALRLSAGAGAGAKVFSMLCTLAQVPIAVRYLGAEGYGLWISLLTAGVMINFVDFGLGVGAQKAMAEAYGRDDAEKIRRVFFGAMAALGLLGLVALLAGVPLALFGGWADRFHVRDAALRAQTGPAMAVTVAAFALGLPLNALARLAGAVQRIWLQSAWIAAGGAATLAALALAARMRWSFLTFLTLAVLVPVAQNFGLWIHLWHDLGWKWTRPRAPDRGEWRAVLGESALFAAPQLALAFALTAPAAAISLGTGAAAVTAFNLLQRLFNPMTQGQMILLTPLWPMFTEAAARGDRRWLRHGLGVAALATLGLGAAVALAAWQADRLIGWWIGAAAPRPGALLIWLTAGWSVALMAGNALMYFLVGTGRVRGVARFVTPGHVIGLAGMFVLGKHFGAEGVVLGALIGALIALGGMLLETRRALR